MNYQHACVTGGAGFIGSHLVDALLKRGMEVTSLDNYLSGKKENLKDARLYPKFHEVKKDVRDVVTPDLEGIDIIFNQAASKKTICLCNPYKDLDINAGGTMNMIMTAQDAGVKRFIHASTGSVYGELKRAIQDENHQTVPVSYYGISKLAGENYVRLVDKGATIMRYFHVFGPRQDDSDKGGVVSIFASRMIHGLPPIINGDGMQERFFTYVSDVINANLFFMDNELSGIFNVANDCPINLLTLVDELNNILGTKYVPEFVPEAVGDIKYFNISTEKLKNSGFIFSTIFKEGLRNTVDYLFTR